MIRPLELTDMRTLDRDGCDQLYPSYKLFMSKRLLKKYGPTMPESGRTWDILFMSRTNPERRSTGYGYDFSFFVSDRRGRDKEVWIGLAVIGDTVIFMMPNEINLEKSK